MVQYWNLLILFAILIVIIFTQIIYIFNFISVTKLAFYSETSAGDQVSVSLTNNELTFLKIGVILEIITISLILTSYIENVGDIQKNKTLAIFNAIFYIIFLLGFVFVSKFAFTAESVGDKKICTLTNTEMVLIKINSVIQWISLILLLIPVLFFLGFNNGL